MSDTNEKKSAIAKFGGWFGLILVAIAGLFFLDQGEIFGETAPEAWTRLKQVMERGSLKVQKAYWRCAIWLKDYLKLAKWISLIWWIVAGVLLVAGIVGKSHGWSEVGTLALRLVGIYLFAGYWFVLAMLAKPLYYGIHALKKGVAAAANAVGGSANHWLGKLGLETPVPELSAASAEKIEAGATAFQRFFFTIAALTLLFGNFFAPSGEISTAVYLLAVGMSLATLAAISAKHGWSSAFGWKMISGLVLVSFVHLVLRLFCHVDVFGWFSDRNKSEKIIIMLAFFPCALWLTGAFWKSKADGFNKAAKRMAWVSLLLLAGLAIKGTVTTHELASTSDETAGKMQKIEDTASRRMLDKAQDIVNPPSHDGSATTSSAKYQAPPAGSSGGTENRSDGHEAPKPQAPVQTRITRKVAVPPAEAPKQYTNPAQAINDLDDLGY